MDTTTNITGLAHDELANLQRIHPTENGDREKRRPPARRLKRRDRKGNLVEVPLPPPTYTPDGQVADEGSAHQVNVSA